jgi:hypothetical protein
MVGVVNVVGLNMQQIGGTSSLPEAVEALLRHRAALHQHAKPTNIFDATKQPSLVFGVHEACRGGLGELLVACWRISS